MECVYILVNTQHPVAWWCFHPENNIRHDEKYFINFIVLYTIKGIVDLHNTID